MVASWSALRPKTKSNCLAGIIIKLGSPAFLNAYALFDKLKTKWLIIRISVSKQACEQNSQAFVFHTFVSIGHFIVVYSAAKPLIYCEVVADRVEIETSI